MTTISFIGTIKSIDIAETTSPEKSYFIKLEEDNGWFITSDSDTFPGCSKLKKGHKYLFSGNLTCFKPTITAHELEHDLSEVNESRLNNNKIAIHGEIADVKFVKSMRGDELAYLKIKELTDAELILFPDLCKEFRRSYEGKKEIIVIGEISTQEPQFVITGADYYE